MASIYKTKDGKGWRAVVRIKNHPTICDHFDRKEEAEDWARDTERKIKLGQYTTNRAKEKTVLGKGVSQNKRFTRYLFQLLDSSCHARS